MPEEQDSRALGMSPEQWRRVRRETFAVNAFFVIAMWLVAFGAGFALGALARMEHAANG